jgi:hypothetical protein
LSENNIDHSQPELWKMLLAGPRVLSLSGNRDIKSKGVLDVVAVIESGLCKCQKLDMGDCGIKQAAGETLLMAIAAVSTFKAISLDKNDFALKIGTDALPAGGKKDRRKVTITRRKEEGEKCV